MSKNKGMDKLDMCVCLCEYTCIDRAEYWSVFKKLLTIDTCNNVGESEKYVEQKRQIQKSTY